RLPRTRPARDSTSRCFLMACRETSASAARRAMDSGPREDSRTTSRSRVSSPSAANSGAASRTCDARTALAADIGFDVLELLGPTLVVAAVGLGSALRGQGVETRLDDGEQRTLRHLFEPELDEGGGLLGVVSIRLDGVRMPAKREQPLGLALLHQDVHSPVLVAGIGDAAAHALSSDEGSVEDGAEPGAELLGVGDGAPDARPRGAQHDLLLDAVGVRHGQPPGCILPALSRKCNPKVAHHPRPRGGWSTPDYQASSASRQSSASASGPSRSSSRSPPTPPPPPPSFFCAASQASRDSASTGGSPFFASAALIPG